MGAAASSRAGAAAASTGDDDELKNLGGAAPETSSTTTPSRGDFFGPIAASVRASPASSACVTPRASATEEKTEFEFSPFRYGSVKRFLNFCLSIIEAGPASKKAFEAASALSCRSQTPLPPAKSRVAGGRFLHSRSQLHRRETSEKVHKTPKLIA